MSEDFDMKRDLGVTPRQQKNIAKKFWPDLFGGSPLVKQPEVKAKRKVAQRQPKSANSLKPKALEMFAAGKSIKEVAAELDITTANARYYFDRVFKK